MGGWMAYAWRICSRAWECTWEKVFWAIWDCFLSAIRIYVPRSLKSACARPSYYVVRGRILHDIRATHKWTVQYNGALVHRDHTHCPCTLISCLCSINYLVLRYTPSKLARLAFWILPDSRRSKSKDVRFVASRIEQHLYTASIYFTSEHLLTRTESGALRLVQHAQNRTFIPEPDEGFCYIRPFKL